MRAAAVLTFTILTLTLLASACGEPTPGAETRPVPAGPVAVVRLHEPAAAAGPLDNPLPVSVATDAAQVRIELPGLDRPAAELMAEIEARATGEVRRWAVDAAPGGAAAGLTVTVPVYALGPGVYVLTVWAGDADPLRRYLFEVGR